MKQFFSLRFKKHHGADDADLNRKRKRSLVHTETHTTVKEVKSETTPRRKSEGDIFLLQSNNPVNMQGVYSFMDRSVLNNANRLYTYGNQSEF